MSADTTLDFPRLVGLRFPIVCRNNHFDTMFFNELAKVHDVLRPAYEQGWPQIKNFELISPVVLSD